MNKKTFITKSIILLSITIIGIIFVYNNYFLYKTPILKIINIESNETKSDVVNEYYYEQKITGIIQNGQYKGKKMVAMNTTTISGVYDEQIHKGSELLVELTKDGSKINAITGIKRDKYLVILLFIFIDLIILSAPNKGIKTIISLIINMIITYLSVLIFQKTNQGINMFLLYSIVAILFIIISLFITNGKSKKTLAAIISSIVSLFFSFALVFIFIKIKSNTIPYWSLEYIEVVHEYINFFYVSILLCGLGAIMDIAITLSSSLNELINKDPKIKVANLIKSGREISKDIVGTMSNVMLFTCFTPQIPVLFLVVKNNISLGNALSMYGQLDLIIVLCSCISIVLAIPISLYISILIFKGKEVMKR